MKMCPNLSDSYDFGLIKYQFILVLIKFLKLNIMKTKFFILITIIFGYSLIISCSKDSDVKITQLQFRVQGHGLKLFDSPTFSQYNGIVSIRGSESYNSIQDPWSISIRFPNSIGIHSIAKLNQDNISITVTDGPFCFVFMGSYCPPFPSYQAIEGSISLTQSTGNKVKGTFHFTAESFDGTPNKIIHSGKFEIEY